MFAHEHMKKWKKKYVRGMKKKKKKTQLHPILTHKLILIAILSLVPTSSHPSLVYVIASFCPKFHYTQIPAPGFITPFIYQNNPVKLSTINR